MQIVIAPNAFKNSLPADKAAEVISEGLHASGLKCICTCFPIGDGGDGTGNLIIGHLNGINKVANVTDPLSRKIQASYGLIEDGKAAVIEMANASGIRLLKSGELNPLQASSFGTGELIKAALDEGVEKIILCIGGSATVDSGSGLLQALGLIFRDKGGNEITEIPGKLDDLAFIDRKNLDKRISGRSFIILCDVENPLLGENGAAKIFGPQKGADQQKVERLEERLSNFSKVAFHETGIDIETIKHGGAAGGIAAGCAAFLNAKLVNGIEEFLQITKFENVLKSCQLVITGEGCIDEQTLNGKGPFGVAKKAKQKNLPVIAFGGKVPAAGNKIFDEYFDRMIEINPPSMDLATAMKNTSVNLYDAAKTFGYQLSALNENI